MTEPDLTPVVALVLSVAVIGFEQLVQWRFGAMGLVGLSLLGVGLKARNVTCSCLGAVVLTLLLTP